MSDKPATSAVYSITRWFSATYFRLYHRASVRGTEHIPPSGGCLIACNHASFLDPPLLACFVRCRPFRFLARDSLWETRFMNWFLQAMCCIPVDRARGDLSAMRGMLRALKQGDAVALFPEGTRSRDGILQEAKPGVGFIVARSGVPVVPAYISGSHQAYPKGARFARPRKVGIRFGEPILPDALPTIEQAKPCYATIAAFITAQIAALADPAG